MDDQKKKTSYELYLTALNLTTELQDREGVTDDELDQRLDRFLDGADDKLGAHRYTIDQFYARAKEMRSEAKRFSERARTMEAVAERIKRHAVTVMQGRMELLGDEKGRSLDADHGLVYLQTYKKLVIDDEPGFIGRHLEGDWVRTVEKVSVDRAAVKKALSKGTAGDIEGAELVEDVTVIFK
jgi:hypothetical protein